jgi:hypothetical protein
VVVGAIITGGIQLWAVHRKDRLDARTAARLLAMVARDVEVALEVSIDRKAWSPQGEPDPMVIAAQAWDEQRISLARRGTKLDFFTVAHAFRILDRMLRARSEADDMFHDEDGLMLMRSGARDFTDAANLLERIAE